jgi:hypothetical protein
MAPVRFAYDWRAGRASPLIAVPPKRQFREYVTINGALFSFPNSGWIVGHWDMDTTTEDQRSRNVTPRSERYWA